MKQANKPSYSNQKDSNNKRGKSKAKISKKQKKIDYFTIFEVTYMFLLNGNTGRSVKLSIKKLPGAKINMRKTELLHSAQNTYSQSKRFSAA